MKERNKEKKEGIKLKKKKENKTEETKKTETEQKRKQNTHNKESDSEWTKEHQNRGNVKAGVGILIPTPAFVFRCALVMLTELNLILSYR